MAHGAEHGGHVGESARGKPGGWLNKYFSPESAKDFLLFPFPLLVRMLKELGGKKGVSDFLAAATKTLDFVSAPLAEGSSGQKAESAGHH